jgi:5-methyltetrahydropteroyltriglutamate--homocysteine methyltransferase
LQAKLLTIKEIEDAGINIVTDGEQGRTSFYDYLTEQLSGFDLGESRTFFGGLSYTGRRKPTAKVELKVEPPPAAKEADFLRIHSARQTKISLISPFFLLNFC